MTSPRQERLPLGSDRLDIERSTRPVYLRRSSLGLVALGGAVGTAAREGTSLAIPTNASFPVAIFAVNLAGAFILGFLLDALARRGPDVGHRQSVRLLLGTGFCGGFTTYSSLASATAVLLAAGAAGSALLYCLATVVLGAAATWAGITCSVLGRVRQ